MTRCAAQAYKTYKLGGKLSEMLYSPATYGVDFGGGGGRDKLPRPKVITTLTLTLRLTVTFTLTLILTSALAPGRLQSNACVQ